MPRTSSESRTSPASGLEDALIEELLAEQPPGDVRSVFPVLLVGLGGTGAEVLRRVKARTTALGLYDAYRFLVLDMDAGTRQPSDELPGFEEDEFLLLPRDRAADVLRAPNRHPDLKQRFDLDRKDLAGFLLQQAESPLEGAGQIRPLGLLGFHLCREAFDELVRKALSALNARWRALEERLQRGAESVDVRRKNYVMIVSSLCGGTGSSCLIDVAAVLRERLRRTGQFELNALLTLPDVYDLRLKGKTDQRAKVAANTYAVLRELDFFQTEQAHREGFRLAGAGPQPLPAPAKLIDTVYVAGRRDAAGVDLVDAPAVYDTLALYLTAEIALTVGDRLATGEANDRIRQGAGVDPFARRNRIYSTISASAVGIPFRRLVRYCAYRRLFEYVDAVLKDAPEAGKAAAPAAGAAGATSKAGPATAGRTTVPDDAGRWLEEAKLEERSKDLLVSRLRTSAFPGTEGYLSKALPAAGAALKDKVFLAEFRGITSRWTSSDLPRIKHLLAQKGDAALKDALGALDAGQPAWMRRSALHARDVLAHLASICEESRAELEREAARHGQAAGLAARDGVAPLKSLSGYFGQFGSDAALQSRLLALHRNLMTEQVDAEVKQVAASVLGRLGRAAADRAAKLDDGTLQQLRILRKDLETRYRACLPARGALWSDSQAEIDATTPEFFEDVYASVPISGADLAPALELLAAPDDGPAGELERKAFARAALRRVLGTYVPEVRKRNVAELLEKELRGGGERARQAAARVEEALAACRPLWQAQTGHADLSFSDYLVLGAPQVLGSRTESVLSDHVEKAKARLNADSRYQAEGQLVRTSDPHRLYAVRRTHGGLPHYLPDFQQWKVAYERWMKDENDPLHVLPGSVVAGLPAAEPLEEAGRHERLFALALAYGFVARRASHYYWNLDADPSLPGHRLAHGSHWEGLAFDQKGRLQRAEGPVARWLESGALAFDDRKRLDPARLLTGKQSGYAAALKKFEHEEKLSLLVEEAFSALRQAASDADVADQLEGYARSLEQRATPKDPLHETYVRSAQLLRREAEELRQGRA